MRCFSGCKVTIYRAKSKIKISIMPKRTSASASNHNVLRHKKDFSHHHLLYNKAILHCATGT